MQSAKMKKELFQEIKKVIDGFKEEDFEKLRKHLRKSRRIFIAGAGRSGFIGQSFAMRLRHLGLESYVVGETISPPAGRGDVVVFISCSGEKKTLIEIARIAGKSGAEVVSLTGGKENELAEISGVSIVIPAGKSVQFGNSLFEQAVFLFLEYFVHYYSEQEKISFQEMYKRHTNLE
jgi:6-phospho-3-hexuloisomerase